jgi:hypothetical protein
MRISGNTTSQPNYVVVIAGEHMQVIAADKWTKADIRTFVFEHTQNSIAHLKRTERMAGAIVEGDEAARRPIVAAPEDILVVAAGGRAGAFSAYIPGWASRRTSEAVTKLINDRRA